jgi:hypothetical protein
MLSDWSVECGADDPVLVVPWTHDTEDPTTGASFVDLRENPYDLDHLPEAEQHPALMHALRALNAGRSPVFTAKCDAWTASDEELARLQFDLDQPAAEQPCGFASYIDLLWRERSIFVSFHQQEQLLHRLARHSEPLDYPLAALECILRPALVDLAGPQEGFAVTVYVRALGADAASAYLHWEAALEAVAGLIRSKDLTQFRPKSTESSLRV